MPIYPGSTTNITLYPTTPTELNIALYPAPTPAGGIALVQSASGTTADGSAGLPVSFGVPCTAGNSVLSFPSWDDTAEGDLADITLVGGGAEALQNVAQTSAQPANPGIHKRTNVAGGETGALIQTADTVRANNIIAEYSGLADAVAEDTATSSATSTTLAIGTITPTSANNLLTAIFAFNADVTAVGIANDVLVSGAGTAAVNGTYTYSGMGHLGSGSDKPYYNLTGTNPELSAITWDADSNQWKVFSEVGQLPYTSTNGDVPLPWDAIFAVEEGDSPAPTVTEIPGWELVGTRTGGSSVWEYVYARIQSTATPQNPTIVLSGSCDIAGAAAAFGGA
jgi:hypothetical protein